ncbi:hypothetical protein CesoFtcFv8_008793 [Champsocephalus esox]|uniref:Synaptopodin 2 n=1 Tax=Champsocephalus esox TaxID=159716 RepID=A0AAN8CC65_9TELE|nr:hypothetical protein CesoFtcFv8_008793 [Champsocephalus esox]
MDPEIEDRGSHDNLVSWSGSDGSQEPCESYNEDDVSDADYPLDPLPAHIEKSDPESPEQLQSQEWESAGEQQFLPEHSGTDVTPALTLTTGQPLGASNRQGPGTGNRRVESSEEGGSSEAPPASVFFRISAEAAKHAEKWNSDSDTDPCRPQRHRARSTRLSHDSQSERNVKETKFKCKQIARLLTDAPNPQNKGALLFKKRRQRVKKYTQVSYGTGEIKLDSKDQIEEETEDVRAAGYNFVATSESEFEEEYSVYHQQHNLNLNWASARKMEAETTGRGVSMFERRRKRIDELVSEEEELRNKGLPVETLAEPEHTEAQNIYDNDEMYMHSDQANYMDANAKQHVEYQESFNQMNNQSNVPKPLVPNRTAKPFLGFHISTSAPAMPGGINPVPRKHEPRFKGQVGIIRAGDGATRAGKGAELFSKRQSRMEKFVVDGEKVQANKARSPSPNASLPNSWRYSSIVRAPPTSSYNPLLSPFHPQSAAKQPLSTSPKIQPKTKAKAAPKHLNPLEIMKHQPYQLDSSLFKYDAVPVAKSSSPKPTEESKIVNTKSPKPTQISKFEVTKNLKQRSDPSYSPYNASVVQNKAEAPAKSPVSGFGRSRSLSLPRRLNSMPSPRLLSPTSTPGIQAFYLPTQRQTSSQEKVYKPLSPWEAASRSPTCSVDDAFVFQSLPSSVASNVKAAGHRRSLPEPPDEWKRRVSLDPAAVGMGHYHAAPAFQAPFISRTFLPEKPAFYGPPFRPAQPLRPGHRASVGYMG